MNAMKQTLKWIGIVASLTSLIASIFVFYFDQMTKYDLWSYLFIGIFIVTASLFVVMEVEDEIARDKEYVNKWKFKFDRNEDGTKNPPKLGEGNK